MSTLELTTKDNVYTAELLEKKAPESIATMKEFLPLETEVMHVRWSGHAVWANIDEINLPEVPRENHTVYPSRGDILFYPGYKNDQEILIACGPTCFKSPAGELAGNHVGTLEASQEKLVSLEESTLDTGKKQATINIED